MVFSFPQRDRDRFDEDKIMPTQDLSEAKRHFKIALLHYRRHLGLGPDFTEEVLEVIRELDRELREENALRDDPKRRLPPSSGSGPVIPAL